MLEPRRRGGVATQRPAKPFTPVRFRSAPLRGLRRGGPCRPDADGVDEVRLVLLLENRAERRVALVADHEVDEAGGRSVIASDAGVEAFVLAHSPVLSLSSANHDAPAGGARQGLADSFGV